MVAARSARNRRPLGRREVADGAAEERDEPSPDLRDLTQVPLEVADDPVHVEARVAARDRVRGVAEEALAHVEGHEAGEPVRVGEGVEQGEGLLRRARTELHQRVGVRALDDGGRPLREDLPLAARRVVLGQPGDLVEQLAAAVVVEPLRRQPLLLGGEAPAHIGAERLGQVVGSEVDVDGDGQDSRQGGLRSGGSGRGTAQASVARRRPAKAQRAAGGKKLR